MHPPSTPTIGSFRMVSGAASGERLDTYIYMSGSDACSRATAVGTNPASLYL
jgi:hypothetical protein